jgi:hypothetical protein
LRSGARIGLSIVPTLVFTLVIAEILRDRFGVPQAVFGGLIVYTLSNTLLPGFILRLAPPSPTEVDVPVPEMELATPEPASTPLPADWPASVPETAERSR